MTKPYPMTSVGTMKPRSGEKYCFFIASPMLFLNLATEPVRCAGVQWPSSSSFVQRFTSAQTKEGPASFLVSFRIRMHKSIRDGSFCHLVLHRCRERIVMSMHREEGNGLDNQTRRSFR